MSLKDKIKFFENQNKDSEKEPIMVKPETEFNKLLNFWNSKNNTQKEELRQVSHKEKTKEETIMQPEKEPIKKKIKKKIKKVINNEPVQLASTIDIQQELDNLFS